MSSDGWGDRTHWLSPEHTISYDDAVREGESRILLVGPRRSGKSSIERVVFHKMSPHETLFLESTHNVDINVIANNNFVRFQTWDFGGDVNIRGDVFYNGKKIQIESIFKNSSAMVYVIDAQEEDYEDALPKLVEYISAAYAINPRMHFEVFLHKVDGDFMTEETKAERQQSVQHYVTSELAELSGDVVVSYHLTSIYDHSTLEAFSKVVQKLVPHLPTLNNLLDILIVSCQIEKSYLVDVKTKLYIATDSNPVDAHSYELCADLVDVVLDVSYIYGAKSSASGGGASRATSTSAIDLGLGEAGYQVATPYDSHSASAIRLNTGMVLYLREVGDLLGLVCIVREEYFAKRLVLDYNIDCLKECLTKLIDYARRRQDAQISS